MRQPQVAVLRAAIVAAIIAAVVTSLFHLTVSERTVDRAIAREEMRHDAADHGQEVFSRPTQKVGLVAGTVVYAVAVGLIFSGAFSLTANRLPGSTRRRALLLAGLALWCLFFAPFLKYPGNPPGVGDPDTVYDRQALYVLMVALSIAGLALVALFGRSLHRAGMRVPRAALAAGAAYAVYFVALLVILPGNPDANDLPRSLLWQFRAASVAGSVIFWGVFGFTFAALLDRAERHAFGAAAGHVPSP